jgi:hypothetical protein
MAGQYCGGPVMMIDGTHPELADQGGLYAGLYERQFRTSSDYGDLTAVSV